MKPFLYYLLLPAALLLAQPSLASSISTTIYDPCTGDIGCDVTGTPALYHGGGTVGGAEYIGDTVGGVADFDILSMDVTLTGTELEVAIVTRFLNDTFTYPNIGYGDLLVSTTGWNPNGTAPYDTDTASTSGTDWSYAFQTCGSSGTSTCSIQAVDGSSGTNLLTSDQVTQDGDYRSDQYVKTDGKAATGQTVIVDIDDAYLLPDAVDGTSFVLGTRLSYKFNLASIGVLRTTASLNNLAFRWQMTCANDIIEAKNSMTIPTGTVPSPSALPLILTGLFGFAFKQRSRLKLGVKLA